MSLTPKAPRIAIIGCGAVTQRHHAPSLRELERRGVLSVGAICDPNPGAIDSVGAFFPGAARMGTTANLAAMGCDIALVASPLRFHAAHAIASLEAGLSVLCEKPIAPSSRDAMEMIGAARANGRLLAVGHMRRFFQSTRFIGEVIADQRLGRLLSFRATEGGAFRWPATTPSFFQKDAAGGGVLIDIGVHTLDLLHWWLGPPLSFRYEDDAMGGLETNCRIALEYGSFQGSVQLSRDCDIPNEYLLEFERASIRWNPQDTDEIALGFRDSTRGFKGRMFAAAPLHTYFLIQWQNVVAAHQGLEPLCVTGEDALGTLTLIERCYASHTFMEPPWFTEIERQRARELQRGGPA